MRLLHLADVHVGVETYGRPASQADLDALPDYFAPGDDRKRLPGPGLDKFDAMAGSSLERIFTNGEAPVYRVLGEE